MSFATVDYTITGRVARVVLDRPQRLNAYSVQMRDDLYEVFTTCAAQPELAAVVLSGRGPAFCAGADLSEFDTAPSPFEARRIRFARDVWRALSTISAPVIAVLHGHVIGSGLEMALLCDTRIASPDTRFAMPEVMLGLLPAATGTQTLPRAVGANPAAEMLLLGRRLRAEDAFRLGLIDRIAEDPLSVVEELTAEWETRPTGRLSMVKEALQRARTASPATPARRGGHRHHFHPHRGG